MTTAIATEARNATLDDLVAVLQAQQSAKLDVVAHATALRARGGQIVVKGVEAEITEEGVTQVDGTYRPTDVFDSGLAAKLNIPVGYLRRLRTDRPDIFDSTVNSFLHGRTVVKGGEREVIHPADDRKFLVRLFSDGEGGGIARAMLSDRYGIMENLDGLVAMLQGIKDSGIDVEIPVCNLSETSMRVRVVAPQVRALAPTLLAGYRSPFAHGVNRANDAGGLDHLARQMGQDPIVFAGFELRNSEVGFGAYSIVPVITALVCTNGMTMTKEGTRRRHVGSAMDTGVQWSTDTVKAHADLTSKMTRDAVTAFLSGQWLQGKVDEIEAKAGKPVTAPAATIEKLSNDLKFDAATQAGILEHFTMGGQLTAGGVVNAITSYVQTVRSADKAQEIEDRALDALDLLARA